MNTETTKELTTTHGLSEKIIKDAVNIDSIVSRCNYAAISHLPPSIQTVVLAKGMRDLRLAMTKDLVDLAFLPLQGTKLGFRTDKDKDGGYPWEIVRDVMIEGMLRGNRPIGNEINIIGGNHYSTLESYERRVREVPGLTDLELEPGVPILKDGGALVPYSATWRLNGKPDSLECAQRTDKDGVVSDTRIPVRVNSGQIVDAILGKAKRKFLARIHERCTGVKSPDADSDVDIVDTVGVAVEADQRAQGTDAAADELVAKHKAKAAAKKDGNAKTSTDPAEGPDGHAEPGAAG